MIWCLLRCGQAILRCFGGHAIPVPIVLLGDSGDAPGATPLPCNPRPGAGVSHASHNHRGTRADSAVNLFWQERQPLPLARLPRFHQTSRCPKALDPGCFPHSTTMPGRRCHGWLSPVPASPWGFREYGTMQSSSSTTALLMRARRGQPTATAEAGDRQDMQHARLLGCAQQHHLCSVVGAPGRGGHGCRC